ENHHIHVFRCIDGVVRQPDEHQRDHDADHDNELAHIRSWLFGLRRGSPFSKVCGGWFVTGQEHTASCKLAATFISFSFTCRASPLARTARHTQGTAFPSWRRACARSTSA